MTLRWRPSAVTTLSLPLFQRLGSQERTAPQADPGAALRLAASGDSRAFRVLYERHVGRVYSLALRLTGESAAAEELTQDVFVRVWEALPSFEGRSAFTTWLHRLTVNTFLTGQRAGRRRERREAGASAPEYAPIESPELRMDLEQAIRGLPEACRTVFVLHDVEGWRHGEIADAVGIAEGTSKAHLFRARRLLREALDR